MPKPVSKRQYRYMMAVLHGKSGSSARGDKVPKSVAGKYSTPPKGDAPESKGKAYEGGTWSEKHHAVNKEKVRGEREDKKRKKANLHKSLEAYLIEQGHKGAGCLVIDDSGRMLLGKRTDNGLWSTPGGKVDQDESFEEAAIRELEEESGIIGRDPVEIYSGRHNGWESKTFVVKNFSGKLKDSGEMIMLKFFEPHEVPWNYLTHYTCTAICNVIQEKLKKSREIKYMLAEEELKKNIIRNGSNAPDSAVYELTHGDALRLISNGTFRFLREAVSGMEDEGIKEIAFDNYVLHLRKHVNDVYSGRITDGHKQIHQFINRSLPTLTAELMSVFEWYMPEDEPYLEMLDESDLTDDVIEGGLHSLVENYKRYNLANIYTEMENIREEVRNGMAVDLQQVEHKMMQLFDKLESVVHDIADHHNKLGEDSGTAIDDIESKLSNLQDKIEVMSRQPVTMEAYSSSPNNDSRLHADQYPYLSKPKVVIDPSGKITISFDSDWMHTERESFLHDMRAKVIKGNR
jgi:8-oxo-dGTP pyrophosphatase MutT (NUDIX family)